MLYPHVINNCVKRHVNVPTYSTSAENVLINEYVQGVPMYQQSMMYNQPMIQNPYFQQVPNMQNQQFDMNGNYQGNVNPTNPYRF